MMTSERQWLGARLKEAREYIGLSQQQVGQALELPRSAISLVESGQRRLDMVELKALAKLYDRPVSYFTNEASSVAPATNVEILARQVEKLSEQDREQVLRFTEYLADRTKSKSE